MARLVRAVTQITSCYNWGSPDSVKLKHTDTMHATQCRTNFFQWYQNLWCLMTINTHLSAQKANKKALLILLVCVSKVFQVTVVCSSVVRVQTSVWIVSSLIFRYLAWSILSDCYFYLWFLFGKNPNTDMQIQIVAFHYTPSICLFICI